MSYFFLRYDVLDSVGTFLDVPQWEESRKVMLTVQYELLKRLFHIKSGISLYPKHHLLTLLLPAGFYWITLNGGKIINHHFGREGRGTEELRRDHRGLRAMESWCWAGSHRRCLRGRSLSKQLQLWHSSETVHRVSLKVFLSRNVWQIKWLRRTAWWEMSLTEPKVLESCGLPNSVFVLVTGFFWGRWGAEGGT